MRLTVHTSCLLLSLLLGGCADMPYFGKNVPGGFQPAAHKDHPRAEEMLQPAGPRATQPMRGSVRDPAATLRDGIRLYNNGDFNGAIARFNAPEIQTAPGAIRVEALKYTAFSYCVTQRAAQCRQAFDRALGIDANFALDTGESGHPMWGPVFDKARAAR